MSETYEFQFLSRVGNMFNAKLSNFTWQEIKAYQVFRGSYWVDMNDNYEIEKAKHTFLDWQSYRIPLLPIPSYNLDKINSNKMVVKYFSHDDDFTWNSMDEFINVLKSGQNMIYKQNEDADQEFPF